MSAWQLVENGGRLMFIYDDFENDAAITLSGDFGDKASRDQFAQLLLARLNTRATDAELERLRADMLSIQAAAEGISRTVNDSVGERLWAVKQIARAALNREGEG